MRGRKKKNRARCFVIDETDMPSHARPDIVASGHRLRLQGRARYRMMLCAAVFIGAYCVLGFRLAAVTLGGSEIHSPHQNVAAQHLESRPEIVDRNGVLLATNLPLIALEVAGKEVWDPEETASRLAALFPSIDEAKLHSELEEGRYVSLVDSLTPAQQDAVFALGLPGVKFQSLTSRFYPQKALAAHVIGHMEQGKGGVMGLERTLEKHGAFEPFVAAVDIRVQQVLEDELAAAMEEFDAIAAWGAVMDTHTGEMIALASLPDFDPNAPGAVPADQRRNRATYDRYELGSAFKTFTAAAAIDAGVAQEGSTYDARGSLRVADKTIRDFHGENRVLTLSEVVQYSSNIGAARISIDLGVEAQKRNLASLGLFDPLPIELAENRAPELPRKWGPVESATVSYGHGISVTPLHLLTAFNAVINDGVLVMPQFTVRQEKTGSRAISPDTSRTMRRILRKVVSDGTAGFAEAPGYFPIGKTATADKPSGGRYARNERIASFVGAFPGYAPRYSVIISFDNPKPTEKTFGYATAGWNAAPTFARIVERIAPTLNIMPVSDETARRAFGIEHVAAHDTPAAPVGGAR